MTERTYETLVASIGKITEHPVMAATNAKDMLVEMKAMLMKFNVTGNTVDPKDFIVFIREEEKTAWGSLDNPIVILPIAIKEKTVSKRQVITIRTHFLHQFLNFINDAKEFTYIPIKRNNSPSEIPANLFDGFSKALEGAGTDSVLKMRIYLKAMLHFVENEDRYRKTQLEPGLKEIFKNGLQATKAIRNEEADKIVDAVNKYDADVKNLDASPDTNQANGASDDGKSLVGEEEEEEKEIRKERLDKLKKTTSNYEEILALITKGDTNAQKAWEESSTVEFEAEWSKARDLFYKNKNIEQRFANKQKVENFDEIYKFITDQENWKNSTETEFDKAWLEAVRLYDRWKFLKARSDYDKIVKNITDEDKWKKSSDTVFKETWTKAVTAYENEIKANTITPTTPKKTEHSQRLAEKRKNNPDYDDIIYMIDTTIPLKNLSDDEFEKKWKAAINNNKRKKELFVEMQKDTNYKNIRLILGDDWENLKDVDVFERLWNRARDQYANLLKNAEIMSKTTPKENKSVGDSLTTKERLESKKGYKHFDRIKRLLVPKWEDLSAVGFEEAWCNATVAYYDDKIDELERAQGQSTVTLEEADRKLKNALKNIELEKSRIKEYEEKYQILQRELAEAIQTIESLNDTIGVGEKRLVLEITDLRKNLKSLENELDMRVQESIVLKNGINELNASLAVYKKMKINIPETDGSSVPLTTSKSENYNLSGATLVDSDKYTAAMEQLRNYALLRYKIKTRKGLEEFTLSEYSDTPRYLYSVKNETVRTKLEEMMNDMKMKDAVGRFLGPRDRMFFGMTSSLEETAFQGKERLKISFHSLDGGITSEVTVSNVILQPLHHSSPEKVLIIPMKDTNSYDMVYNKISQEKGVIPSEGEMRVKREGYEDFTLAYDMDYDDLGGDLFYGRECVFDDDNGAALRTRYMNRNQHQLDTIYINNTLFEPNRAFLAKSSITLSSLSSQPPSPVLQSPLESPLQSPLQSDSESSQDEHEVYEVPVYQMEKSLITEELSQSKEASDWPSDF